MRSLRPFAVLLVVVASALALRPAEAKGNPIDPGRYPELTQSIITPKTGGERKGALVDLRDAPRSSHATVYGQVLGPVFRDTNLTGPLEEEARREMYATVIAHLADDQPEPDDNSVLLVRDFLPLLAQDPELVALLRSKKLATSRGRQKGWARILDAARTLLSDEDAKLRRSAIRISAHCDCVDEAVTLAALYEAVKAAGEKASPEDQTTFLAAAEHLLKYRFATLSALLQFLGERAQRFETAERRKSWTAGTKYRIRAEFLADVIDLYRAKGGEGIRKAREAALVYGKTVIEKATGPADLLVFFDPEREPFPALQRAAMAAAAPPRMKPAANAAWADLLVHALQHSDDGGVLERVIAVIGETFTQPTKDTQLLAGAVARRIARGADVDTIASRESLAGILGSIGSRGDVRAALPPRLGAADAGQKQVWSVLIRGFGLVQDGLVTVLTPYYRASGERRPPQWARLAVAEALGLQGFRGNDVEAPQASIMLHHILTGDAVLAVQHVPDPEKPDAFEILTFVGADVAKAPDGSERLLDLPAADKEDDSAVIVAAIEGLEFYHSADAARVLGQLAVEEGRVGDTALKILGRQLGRGSVWAASALAGLLGAEAGLADARIQAVLDAVLQAQAPKGGEARAVLGAAVRDVMGRSPTADVRSKAALVSVHLADVESVKPFYVAWNGLGPDDEARKVWGELLRRLVVAVGQSARDGGEKAAALDRKLAEVLRDFAAEGQRGLVLDLFAAMGADADRFDLKWLRADVHFEYATDKGGRTKDARRADLDAALQLFRELVAAAPKGKRSDFHRSIFMVLSKRSEAEWLADGEKPEVLQLAALKAAADSRHVDTARDALDKIGDPLVKQPGSLSAAQKGELDQTVQRLRSLLETKPK